MRKPVPQRVAEIFPVRKGSEAGRDVYGLYVEELCMQEEEPTREVFARLLDFYRLWEEAEEGEL